MSREKRLTIDGVGEVVLKKHPRSKRLRITVRPAVPVSVTIPRWVSYRDAEAFLNEKLDWVKKQLDRAKAYEGRRLAMDEAVARIDRKAAKAALKARLDELAETHGYSYTTLTLRNQKTRWGSCSGKNGINLNVKLMLIPERLRDYVLLHELVHTVHKNHGPGFWRELLSIMPDADVRRRELKEISSR